MNKNERSLRRRPGVRRCVIGWLGVTVLAITVSAADEPVKIDFRNRIPGVLDAPVYDFDRVTRLDGGEGFLAVLYISATSPDSLAPVGEAMPFLTETNTGYWGLEPPLPAGAAQVTLPEGALGQQIWFQVRVEELVPTFPFPSPVLVGSSRIYSMILTNSVMPLVGFESFSLTPEELRIRRQGDQVVIEWDYRGARQYDLEATSNLRLPVQWQTVFTRAYYGDPYEVLSVTNALTSTPQFYRLERWR